MAVASPKFFRIEAPPFVAGLSLGLVTAPILRYMLHWYWEDVWAYCIRKRWRISIA